MCFWGSNGCEISIVWCQHFYSGAFAGVLTSWSLSVGMVEQADSCKCVYWGKTFVRYALFGVDVVFLLHLRHPRFPMEGWDASSSASFAFCVPIPAQVLFGVKQL
jgi:hypothetical protein